MVRPESRMARACSAARQRRLECGLLADFLRQLLQTVVDRLQVGEDELGVDGLDVVDGRDPALHVDDVGIVEDTHHLADGVALADGGQELVAEALALRGALHDARRCRRR